ncbi:Mu transposase C-terminal domain-containing protein [Brevibacillus sp. SYSU BS000544]|uniref:Mu transposase C-terminal domain-containing protein n=1 Tax=Brevibacillus sp. SYSU BS000544 TaxID=3416443 RepID=UPI003CE5C7B8
MSIVVNDLICFIGNDGTETFERILWIDEGSVIAYTIDIYDANALPRTRKVKELVSELHQDHVRKHQDDPWITFINETEMNGKSLQIRDKAWNIISEIVAKENEPAIYVREKRGLLIQKAMNRSGTTKMTVYKYLRKFWQRGLNKNALLPDYDRSGGKGKEKTSGDKKRGRPRKNVYAVGTGVNVTDEIKQIFRTAVAKYYLNEQELPLSTAYLMMIKEFFAEDYRFDNGVKKAILVPEEEIPTLTQFKYWYEKEHNIKQTLLARKGRNKFEKDLRPVLGSSTAEVIGPGSRYQIDATIGDIYLVSRYNRNWIIGRPVIYAVIDVFSRLVTGVYVGLEGPSWLGAMMALTNAASDKVKFCKEYGIAITKEEWPSAHLPEVILGDRGELEGRMVETLSNALHVRIENTAPYRADWKGIVEQYFRTINLKVKPFLPGFIDIDFRQRGGKDYRLDARLDLFQFTQIIVKCVIYHNNKHLLKDYSRDEMMIEDNVTAIPIELWNWGVANRSGKLRSFPEDIVKLNLLPADQATVTYRGIKYKQMYYSCDRALKEYWFERARKASWKVEISYDPRDMSFIYIRHNGGRDYDKCQLLETQERYYSKTLDEIMYLLEHEGIEQKQQTKKQLQDTVDLMSDIEHIVIEAEKLSSHYKEEVSNAQRVGNIRKNRMIERESIRQIESFDLGRKNDEGTPAEVLYVKEIEEFSDNKKSSIELLRQKQKERLNGRNK